MWTLIESEIQFLLGLVLNHKLTAGCKKICLERIGHIEERLRSPQAVTVQTLPLLQRGNQQSPSTQALLDKHPDLLAPAPVHAAPVHIPPAARDKETGMVNVVTSTTSGGSTRGPSKVFR